MKKKIVSDFLPSYLVEGEETLHLEKPENSIGEMKSFYGNFLVVVKALTYIKTLGREGIPEGTGKTGRKAIPDIGRSF